jgi:hypothetical protein
VNDETAHDKPETSHVRGTFELKVSAMHSAIDCMVQIPAQNSQATKIADIISRQVCPCYLLPSHLARVTNKKMSVVDKNNWTLINSSKVPRALCLGVSSSKSKGGGI